MSFLEKRRRLREAQQSKEEEESYVPIDLFGSQPPLGIFTNTQLDQPGIELKMWKKCQEREMKILSTPAPRNFLEEMAVKTERGILWNFPINNEQGIDETKVNNFGSDVLNDPRNNYNPFRCLTVFNLRNCNFRWSHFMLTSF